MPTATPRRRANHSDVCASSGANVAELPAPISRPCASAYCHRLPATAAGAYPSASRIVPATTGRFTPQILEQQVFVGALGVRLGDRPRPGAVHHDRNAVLAIEARVRVERHTDCRNIFAEYTPAMLLDRLDQALLPGRRLQRPGEEQPP